MVIWTNGCFDILHTGHVNLLLFCRQIAGPNGEVIVSLDEDQKIRSDKGVKRPVMDAQDRWNAIHALRILGNPVVNRIFTHWNNELLHGLIASVKPDYIVVGSEYQGKKVIGDDISKVIFFETDKRFSSTKIIEACRK